MVAFSAKPPARSTPCAFKAAVFPPPSAPAVQWLDVLPVFDNRTAAAPIKARPSPDRLAPIAPIALFFRGATPPPQTGSAPRLTTVRMATLDETRVTPGIRVSSRECTRSRSSTSRTTSRSR